MKIKGKQQITTEVEIDIKLPFYFFRRIGNRICKIVNERNTLAIFTDVINDDAESILTMEVIKHKSYDYMYDYIFKDSAGKQEELKEKFEGLFSEIKDSLLL